jgi:hypothetical protein
MFTLHLIFFSSQDVGGKVCFGLPSSVKVHINYLGTHLNPVSKHGIRDWKEAFLY